MIFSYLFFCFFKQSVPRKVQRERELKKKNTPPPHHMSDRQDDANDFFSDRPIVCGRGAG